MNIFRIFSKFILVLLVLLPTIIVAQTPIMIVTCKRSSITAELQQNKNNGEQNILELTKDLNKKQSANQQKQLKIVDFMDPCIGFCDDECEVCVSIGPSESICVPSGSDGASLDCECPPGWVVRPSDSACIPPTPDCLTCSSLSISTPIWSYQYQTFICPVIDGDVDTALSGTDGCNCPPGTVPIDFGDGIVSCEFADCYTGDLDPPILSCDEVDPGNLKVTICGINPAGSYVPILDIINCEIVGTDVASLLATTVAPFQVGAVDDNFDGCIEFLLQNITDGAMIELEASSNAIISLNASDACMSEAIVEVDDPCTCSTPFNEVTGLYTDKLTVSMLPDGTEVILDINTEGFKNISGDNIAPGVLGIEGGINDQDGLTNGIFCYTFYRSEGDRTEIDLNVAELFLADTECPNRTACLAPIPTLGEWGLLSLGLLLMILGVTRIKELEQSKNIQTKKSLNNNGY